MTDRSPLHPYPGLRPFERHEAEIFFGRERQTDELLTRLGRGRFLAVSGASGCGKSSLVRAGLMAALEAGLLPQAGARWRVAELRPGQDPFGALADALLRPEAIGAEWSAPFADPAEARAFLLAALRRGPLGLAETLRQAKLPANTRLLLVVDQFEELFRYMDAGAEAADHTARARRADEAATFVELLLAGIGEQGNEALFLCLTLRSDFLGDCARFRGLPERINAGLYLTPRLERAELAQAIAWPARLFDGEVESALVNRLVNEAADDPDQLPLLQHALMRLWSEEAAPIQAGGAHRREEGGVRIGLADFEGLGGLQQALSDHADAIFTEKLDEAGRKIAETLFRALTERETEGRDIRRPMRLERVAELARVPWTEVAKVADAFRAEGAHFLTPALSIAPELKPEHILDISHESLIRQWGKLKEWVEAEAKAAAEFRRLRDNQERLTALNALLDSPELENAVAWRDRFKPTPGWALRYGGDLAAALDFLKRSEQARRRRRQAKALLVFTIIGLLSLLSGWALHERGQAEQAAVKAEASERQRTESLFDSQLTHGALLARVEDYAQARQVLGLSRALDPGIPETRRHARNLLAGYVEIMGGEAEMVYRGAGAVLSGGVAVSPDGRWLAAAGERGTLVIFDAESGELVRRLEGHDPKVNQLGRIWSIVFAPQGRWLYSGGDDGRLLRWGLGAPVGGAEGAEWTKEEWQGPSATGLMALALSSDGATLASGDAQGRITLWEIDPATGAHQRREQPLEGHTDAINSPHGLAFSPDGQRLASASFDQTARIWDLKAGKELRRLEGHTDQVIGVAFSPDGKLVATTGGDKQAILWNAETGRPLRPLRGHQNIVFGAAFTTDGRGLLTASRDNTLRLWDPASAVTMRLFQGHEQGLWSVAARGDRIYTASDDGTVRRWRLGEATAPASAGSHAPRGNPQAGAPRQPDEPAAAEAEAGAARRAAEAVPTQRVGTSEAAPTGAAQWLWEFTPESKGATDEREEMQRLLAELEAAKAEGDGEGNADRQRALLARLLGGLKDLDGPSASPISTAISPDGAFVAVGFKDGALRLYPLPTGAASSRDSAPPPADAPSRLQAAPTGDSPATPNPLWQDDQAHGDQVLRIAFNREGTLLATASMDNTARLWRIEGRGEGGTDGPRLTPLHTLEGHAKTVHAVAFSPIIQGDGQTLATAGYDGKVGLFDTATGEPRQPLFQAHEGKVANVAFADDGTLLTTGYEEGIIRLWNPSTTPPTPIVPPIKSQDAILWGAIRPDARQLAAVGRDLVIRIHDLPGPPGVGPNAPAATEPRSMVGHEQTVFRAHYTPDGRQLATVSHDMTVRLWDLEAPAGSSPALFTLRLPAQFQPPQSQLWDFDLRRTPDGMLWIAVPLTMGRLALYRLPYDQPPP